MRTADGSLATKDVLALGGALPAAAELTAITTLHGKQTAHELWLVILESSWAGMLAATTRRYVRTIALLIVDQSSTVSPLHLVANALVVDRRAKLSSLPRSVWRRILVRTVTSVAWQPNRAQVAVAALVATSAEWFAVDPTIDELAAPLM